MSARGSIFTVVGTVAILGGLWLMAALAGGYDGGEGCPHSRDFPTRRKTEEIREAILCLLNEERARNGLPALTRNRALELAAQRHSRDMAARRYFEHETPDGIDPLSRMLAAGYSRNGRSVGENLYWGDTIAPTPIDALDAWMHSPGHRANILLPDFAEVGVGVAAETPSLKGKTPSAVYTTDFGGRPVR